MELAGKRVLITGGAVRVGAALSRAFADAGSRVVIHCRHSTAAAEELRRSLPGAGHCVVVADFSAVAQADFLFDQIDGAVDILINNASLYRPNRDNPDPAEEQEYLQVNCLAPLSLVRQLVGQPGLVSGAVVNILDQEIGKPSQGDNPYLASRRMLGQATLELARTLAPRIRVNGVAPGPVLPPVWLPESRMEKTLAGLPLGRPVALGDLAAAVLFLAANESITGDIMFVDCGQHLS